MAVSRRRLRRNSLQGGDLNAINPPLTIHVTNLEEANAVARVTAWRTRHLCLELAKNGIALAWSSFVDDRTDDAVAALEEFRGAALQKEHRINVAILLRMPRSTRQWQIGSDNCSSLGQQA